MIQQNPSKSAQNRENTSRKSHINELKSKIRSSFQLLKINSNKTRSVCHQSFKGILKLINQIKEINDVSYIHQKVNLLKILAERCSLFYRMFGNCIKNYEKELKPLITVQNQQKFSSSTASHITELKQKIHQTFEVLKINSNKTRPFCRQTFKDILSVINQIQNTDNVSQIYQKANLVKILTERCFFFYRMLGNGIQIYEKVLIPLIEIQSQSNIEHNQKPEFIQNVKFAQSKDDRQQEKHQNQLLFYDKQDKNVKKILKEEKLINQLKEKDQFFSEQLIFEYKNPEYYESKYLSFGQIEQRYRPLSRQEYAKYLPYAQKKEGYFLDHIGKKLDIIEFVKYDWKKVVVMNLNDCKLNSNDWKVFCSHHYLFQNLKILSITSNYIRNVQKEDLQKFPSLKGLNFKSKTYQINFLSQQSIRQLKQYMEENKGKIKIYLPNSPKK